MDDMGRYRRDSELPPLAFYVDPDDIPNDIEGETIDVACKELKTAISVDYELSGIERRIKSMMTKAKKSNSDYMKGKRYALRQLRDYVHELRRFYREDE